MNPFKSKNIVAKIIQVYAYLNVIAGAILSFIAADAVSGFVAMLYFCAVLFVSFMLYAFGEIIDLLQDIKSNTHAPNVNVADEERPAELPDL